jgi:hypothetical protein
MGARRSRRESLRGRSAVGVLVLGAAGLLAACGSSSSSSSSSSTTTTGAPASTAVGGSDVAAKLDALAGNVKSAQKSTFQAVYTSSSGGSTSTITLAQSPPKQLFRATDSSGSTTSLINTGTTTYSCSGGGGSAVTCTSIGGRVAGAALTSLVNVYNGSTALTVFDAWRSAIVARVAGVSLTFTTETIGGQPSTCANWNRSGDTATYCVTSTGVLAKVESSGGSSGSGTSFELTSYSTSPPASAFAVPQGATVVTLPGGVSAP